MKPLGLKVNILPVFLSCLIMLAAVNTLTLAADAFKAIAASGACDLDGGAAPTDAQRRTAIDDARRKALKSYVDSLKADPRTEAKANIIYSKGLLEVMHLRLDDYAPEATVVREEVVAGIYRAFCAVKISVSQIQALLDTAGGMTSDKLSEEMLAFIVVARQVDAVKRFKAHEVDQQSRQRSAQDDTGRAATAEEDGGNISERVVVTENETEQVRVETGGSVEQKAERVAYRRCSTSTLESRFAEVFNTAGIELIPSEDLAAILPEVAEADDEETLLFLEDPVQGLSTSFADEKRFTPKLNIFKAGAYSVGCQWFGLAKLTAGREELNPQTGQTEIAVVVDVYLAQLKPLGKTDRLIYRKVASRVQTIRGGGTNPEEARNNGLLVAGRFAAQNIVDQIRAVVARQGDR